MNQLDIPNGTRPVFPDPVTAEGGPYGTDSARVQCTVRQPFGVEMFDTSGEVARPGFFSEMPPQ